MCIDFYGSSFQNIKYYKRRYSNNISVNTSLHLKIAKDSKHKMYMIL